MYLNNKAIGGTMKKIASMTVLVPKDLHRQFKVVAAKKGKTMTKLLLEAIEKAVKKDKENE